MKTFLVENTRKGTTIRVSLHNPPYENENILYRTGYQEKDCIITELAQNNTVNLNMTIPLVEVVEIQCLVGVPLVLEALMAVLLSAL